MLDLDYEQGLRKLEEMILRKDRKLLVEFDTLKSRLIHNVQNERQFGERPSYSSERAEIIFDLGQFAIEHFNIHFVGICQSSTPSSVSSSITDEQQVAHSQPSASAHERWKGGAEITVEGNTYVIHDPVEAIWATDRSTLQQRAKAQQLGANRMVWLKQVQIHRATSTSILRKTVLEKESRLLDDLEQVQAQGFPRCLAFRQTPATATLVYIATQGRSLTQAFGVTGKPLDAHLTLMLLRSVAPLCDVLKVLHTKRLAHRALLPDTILLLNNRRIALQDVGLAAHKYEPGEGPEMYRAPEQAIANKSLATPGPQTDIYRTGAILYHLLAGRLPSSPWEILPPSTYNNALSQELDTVLLRAIAPSLKDRWHTVYDFSNALKKVLS